MIDEEAYKKAVTAVTLRRNMRAAYPDAENLWALDEDRMFITVYERSRQPEWNK